MTAVVHSRDELAKALAALPRPLGLVPTMGALHAGHRALLDASRAQCAATVATVFVNPLQFGPNEDLSRYPRTLDADVAMCEQADADLVWAPAVEDVYPDGPAVVRVDPGPLGDVLEGAVRPGHFGGVLTVVAKLLNLVRPDVAFFGEKDYQQLVVITRMATDLELGVQILGVPTVREPDGLALSSRNVYLTDDDRRTAAVLSRALFAARDVDGTPDARLSAARDVLSAAGITADYLQLLGTDLGAAPVHGAARLLVAARIGTPRLIDNVGIEL